MSTAANTMTLTDDPLIREHPGVLPFWEAAAQGRFVLPTCNACGKVHWYPRTFCPLCFADDISWRDSAGGGIVYAFSSMPRATPVTVVAYVRLDEGPLVLTNLIGCRPDEPSIGRRVQVSFAATDGARMLPMFRLV